MQKAILACHILHFNISQATPNKNLMILAEFCMKVYFPSWYDIKINSRINKAAAIYF